MDFITIAKQRMSVRDYKETKVEPEKLEQILELLMWPRPLPTFSRFA